MKCLTVPIIIIILSAIFFQCDYKTSSEGEFDHLIVFSDSSLFIKIEPLLAQTLVQFIYTPHTERSFLFAWKPLYMLDSYQKRRNLIFLGTLEGSDNVSEYVKRMLSPEIRDRVANGEVFDIFTEDMYATNQLGIILCAPTEKQLFQNLELNGENIFNNLEKYNYKRLNEVIYSESEQKDIEEYISEEYGIKMRIPYSYQVVTETEDKNFIWIKRTDPSRSIFMYRMKADSTLLNDQFVIKVRDSLATRFYEGDSILLEDTYSKRINFLGYNAIKMVGIWQNHEQIIGGPFRTYVFFDSGSSNIYFLDISVVAPGKRKKPYLDQLEVIAHTFEILPKSSR